MQSNPVFQRLNNHIKLMFGVVVRHHLDARGIKHKFAATAIGVKPEYFSRVLKGQDFLDDKAICAIAKLLGISVNELMSGVLYSNNLADFVQGE